MASFKLIVGLISVAAAGAGAGAGTFLAKQLKPPIVIYEGGNVEEYLPDVDAIIAKYESVKKAGGDFAKSLSPVELINTSYYLFDQHTNHHHMTVGWTHAIIMGTEFPQDIYSYFVRDNDVYFEEQKSVSSMVALNNRMWEQGNETLRYWGSSGKYDNKKDYTPETVSNEQYAIDMGANVSMTLRYIVSDKTIVYGSSSADQKQTGVTKDNGKLIVDAELDKVNSVLFYRQQMKTMSALLCHPPFDYVHLVITMDEKTLALESMVAYEGYVATLSSGIGSKCVSRLKNVYSSEGNVKVPGLLDVIEYPAEL